MVGSRIQSRNDKFFEMTNLGLMNFFFEWKLSRLSMKYSFARQNISKIF